LCKTTLRAERPPAPGYPATPTTLGEHLKRRRLDLGLTQRQVAKQLGVNSWTVINWEQNRTQPLVALLPRLYDFLSYCLWRPCRSLGDRLRLRQEVAGMSRRECAKYLGLDEGTLARIEACVTKPARSTAAKLGGFLAGRGDEN